MTDDSPAIAPILMMGRSHASWGPAALIPTAIGSGTASSLKLTIPVSTSATAM